MPVLLPHLKCTCNTVPTLTWPVVAYGMCHPLGVFIADGMFAPLLF